MSESVQARVLLAARILVCGFCLMTGAGHFMQVRQMAGYMALAVLGTGALLVGAGLSIVLGSKPKLGVLCLVGFFPPVTLLMHDFWNVADAMARQMQMVLFLKNWALFGSVLMYAAIPDPWPIGLDAGRGPRP